MYILLNSSNRAKRGRISRVNQLTSVPLVDLAITPTSAPRGSVFRGPLQVDLTCELEDEVFVVLEDINPLNRAATITLPITLGSTPTRPLPRSRRGRHGIQRSIQTMTLLFSFLNKVLLTSLGIGNGDLSSSLQNSEPSSSSLSLDHVLENTSTQAEKAAPVSDAGPSPPNSIRCPICLDSLHQIKNEKQQNMFSTTCGHLFCEPCITQVIASTKQCPTCRQSLTTRKIHPVFI